MVFQVARLGNPDGGVIVTGYLACLLVAGAYLAIGMLFSAVTRNQVVAFILGITGCILFLVIGLPQTQQLVGDLLGGYAAQVVSSLSLVDHFESLTRGLVELQSIFFFLAFTACWLVSGMLVLRQTKAS